MKNLTFIILFSLTIVAKNAISQDYRIDPKSKKNGEITSVSLVSQDDNKRSVTYRIVVLNNGLKEESYTLHCILIKDKYDIIGSFGYPVTINNLRPYNGKAIDMNIPNPYIYKEPRHKYHLVFYIKENGLAKRTIDNSYYEL